MTQRTDIWLVRHGETEWNRTGRYQGTTDIPLNDIGLEQARLVAQRLAAEHWDAIIASPLSRALETARAIAHAANRDDVDGTLDDLTERAYGDAEGLTIAEREERWPDGLWPGLEPQESIFARARRVLASVLANHARKRVILVSHGGLINAILHEISDGEQGTGVTRILNTSITRIATEDGEHWEIEAISDADHLIDEDGVLQVLQPAGVDSAGSRAAARSGD